MKRWIAIAMVMACTAPRGGTPEHPAARVEPELDYTFRYVAGAAPVVQISLAVRGAPSGVTTFELGRGFSDVSDPEASIRDVTASDEAGAPLPVEQQTPHTWRVRAAANRPITLRYAIFSIHAGAPTTADRFRTIVTGHLVHFIGWLALVEPVHLRGDKHDIRFTWQGLDTARLGPATSFGSRTTHTVHESLDGFRSAVFLASDALRVTTWRAGDGTLELAVAGAWPFADAELADHIAKVIAIERAFFEDPGVPLFVVTVFPLGAGGHQYGGTGYTRSFDLALASGTKLEPGVLEMLVHEYFHTWNGGLIAPEAFEDLTYWFTEGFTSFYAARLRYRAGLISLADYVRELDAAVLDHLRSPARELPGARLAGGSGGDHDVSELPYNRGHVIALVADREIRRATGGAVSLDDVMRALAAAGQKGGTITSDRILAMIESLTSTAFAARLRATVIDGAPLAIDPGLFAPCLSGSTAEVWTFDLGFDYVASARARAIVGLRPGSAAARAGVREGDRLRVRSIYHGDPDRPVELTVGDPGRKVSYLPRGTQITVPVFAVGDAATCPDILGAPLAAR